jgi:hypothetical protein
MLLEGLLLLRRLLLLLILVSSCPRRLRRVLKPGAMIYHVMFVV